MTVFRVPEHLHERTLDYVAIDSGVALNLASMPVTEHPSCLIQCIGTRFASQSGPYRVESSGQLRRTIRTAFGTVCVILAKQMGGY